MTTKQKARIRLSKAGAKSIKGFSEYNTFNSSVILCWIDFLNNQPTRSK